MGSWLTMTIAVRSRAESLLIEYSFASELMLTDLLVVAFAGQGRSSGLRWDGVVGANQVCRVHRGLDAAEPVIGLGVPEAARWPAGLGEVEIGLPGRPGRHRGHQRRDPRTDGRGHLRGGRQATAEEQVVGVDRSQRASTRPGAAHLPA